MKKVIEIYLAIFSLIMIFWIFFSILQEFNNNWYGYLLGLTASISFGYLVNRALNSSWR